MIHGIFYARFLPQEGVKVVHQSPPGFLVSDDTIEAEIDFDAISEFVIPRPAFRNRLISVRDPSGKFIIIGYPVNISDEKYERNEFMFNFGIVVPDKFDTKPYEAVVRRLADTFREMEIQNQYLSMEGQCGGKGIGALLEIIREDLNNYNECMIPVDNATTINTKLFPLRPDPPVVKAWHVPLALIDLSAIMDDKWDLSMRKIIPEIDGIRDVRKIAHHADVSLALTKQALRHLLYHDTIILVDIFFFTNIYVIMSGIDEFMSNKSNIQEECARYVTYGSNKLPLYLFQRFFNTFQHGRSVKDWIKLHTDDGIDVLSYIDVRRLTQFGVMKGILHRQQKYAISKRLIKDMGKLGTEVVMNGLADADLLKYCDGCHSFDQITVETGLADEDIVKELKKLLGRDLEILYR